MKQCLLCFSVICFLIACTTEDKKIPKEIMPVDKMKIVVWDMLQAGNYATTLKEKDTSIKKINTAYMAEVLKLHNISKDEFFKSFDFYVAHPQLNKELFDSLNAYGQRRRTDLYKKKQ